jgi:hypothetical protein
VFDAVALAGGYGLMRVLGAGRVVALGTSAVYLLAPTTVGMLAFGGTFTGFTLLPTYALVDLLVMRALTSGRRNLMIGAAAGYAAVKTGALFLDGYSFVISALLSAALWMPWLLRGSVPRRTRALGLATLIGGHLIAVLAYELYAPAVFDPNPLAVTRALGLDLSTLVAPSDVVWAAGLLGVDRDSSAWPQPIGALAGPRVTAGGGPPGVRLRVCRRRHRAVLPHPRGGPVLAARGRGAARRRAALRPAARGPRPRGGALPLVHGIRLRNS